jgi:uncharacterized protein (TIGR02246 family)
MPTLEDSLHDIVEERVAAVHKKDPEPLTARQHPDVVTFDVVPPLRSLGKGPVEEKTRNWFDGYASDIGYEVRELRVKADDRLGFCWFVYHVTGTLQSGIEVDMWVRATLCCERIDGGWKIIHDHESVPFDPATGKAEIALEP